MRSMGGERTKFECTRRSWSRQHFGRSPRSCDIRWLPRLTQFAQQLDERVCAE